MSHLITLTILCKLANEIFPFRIVLFCKLQNGSMFTHIEDKKIHKFNIITQPSGNMLLQQQQNNKITNNYKIYIFEEEEEQMKKKKV